jgi:Arc/MetJ family transcription regulator
MVKVSDFRNGSAESPHCAEQLFEGQTNLLRHGNQHQLMISVVPGEIPMRTTLALDDDLIATAQAYTGVKEKSALVREALKALIEREAARRLARLGGSMPDFEAAPRRRPGEA